MAKAEQSAPLGIGSRVVRRPRSMQSHKRETGPSAVCRRLAWNLTAPRGTSASDSLPVGYSPSTILGPAPVLTHVGVLSFPICHDLFWAASSSLAALVGALPGANLSGLAGVGHDGRSSGLPSGTHLGSPAVLAVVDPFRLTAVRTSASVVAVAVQGTVPRLISAHGRHAALSRFARQRCAGSAVGALMLRNIITSMFVVERDEPPVRARHPRYADPLPNLRSLAMECAHVQGATCSEFPSSPPVRVRGGFTAGRRVTPAHSRLRSSLGAMCDDTPITRPRPRGRGLRIRHAPPTSQA